MNQKIRIKLRSYDYNLVDKSTEKIVKTVRASGAVVTGPIPLPTEKEVFTVLRSPHVNKKAREQFQLRTHKRLIEIYTPTQKTVDALSKLELPSGVDIQVKLTWRTLDRRSFNEGGLVVSWFQEHLFDSNMFVVSGSGQSVPVYSE